MPEIGQTLSHYRISAKLGQGGMGEVFLAHDSALDRDVALKFLPPGFSSESEHLARFEREARLLALLNHPNIAAIHGLERAEGKSFLVLELVDGETLAEKIAHRRLGVEDALAVCRQVAEGMEAAHERGIIHRDLKPANIKITPEGKVKILDFGLAKAQDLAHGGPLAEAGASEQPTEMATQAGLILGTVAYMSPEQARGHAVGKPTDIWAFGCVLYETLTGRRPFRGDTNSDYIAAILKGDPDWNALPAVLREGIRRLLRRCLQKDASRRIQHFADVRLEIEDALAAPAPETAPAGKAGRAGSPWTRPAVAAGIVLALLGGVAGGITWSRRSVPPAADWEGTTLGGAKAATRPRVSPDGSALSFQVIVNGLTQVAVMKPESGNWQVLTRDRTRGLVENTCWSPDGTRIYYSRYMDKPIGVFSVPVPNGDERLVLEDALVHQVLPDGSLLVSRLDGDRRYRLHRFHPQTGALEPLGAFLYNRSGFSTFGVFRDGKEAVFVGRPLQSPGDAPNQLYAIDLLSGQSRRLAPAINFSAMPVGLPLAVSRDDHEVLLIIPKGSLQRIVAVPRDGASSWRVVATLTRSPLGMDVGPDGSIYVDQTQRPVEITRFTPEGAVDQRTALTTSGQASEQEVEQALALPDGRVLVSGTTSERLMLLDGDKEAVPFIDSDEKTSAPMALVGGRDVAFLAGTGVGRTVVIASAADGRILRRLKGVSGQAITTLAASPDGRTIFFVTAGVVWAIPATDGQPRRIREGDGVAVDPGGRYLVISLKKEGWQLVRVPIAGGTEEPIRVRGDAPLILESFAGNAVGADGRIAVIVAPRDSWFWPAGVLDPRTGDVMRLSSGRDVDMTRPGWTPDGHILTWSMAFTSSIWRLRPIPATR